MYAISDLTTLIRPTTGTPPPPLAGPSTTVHPPTSSIYLFGGRLVSHRRMLADMYRFDIDGVRWEKVDHRGDVPKARYFHSADVWDANLVVFGGMTDVVEGGGGELPEPVEGVAAPADPPNLAVLNDIHLFSLSTHTWLPPPPPPSSESEPNPHIPKARYAHLSAISGSHLYVIGGHDLTNTWLDNVHVYSLPLRRWVAHMDYPRHCGTYRSVAVCAPERIVYPVPGAVDPEGMGGWGPGKEGGGERTDPGSLQHPAYSEPADPERPEPVWLYSNYNFTDVQRELQVLRPRPHPEEGGEEPPLEYADETHRFSSAPPHALPPGLRFPTGAMLGSHLLLCGTYIAHGYQAFSLWALNLRPPPSTPSSPHSPSSPPPTDQAYTWQRIDLGSALSTGSWSRGVLHPRTSKFLIFGNRAGSLVEDYNRRLLSFTHVAFVDLEALAGLFSPPAPALPLRESELGLAVLESSALADFELVCTADGRSVPVNRRVLDARWPWFRAQRRSFLQRAQQHLAAHPEQVDPSWPISLPPSPPASPTTLEAEPEDPFGTAVQGKGFGGPPLPTGRTDPRLTPRRLLIPEPYPIALAFAQYLYTLTLCTPLQRAPPVLSALLVMSVVYEMPHLMGLCVREMHGLLGEGVGGGKGRQQGKVEAVGVYEVATVCDCQSLQIRALRVVMGGKSTLRGPRSRHPERHDPQPDPGPGGAGGGPPEEDKSGPARPRGMSGAMDLQGYSVTASSAGPAGGTVQEGGEREADIAEDKAGEAEAAEEEEADGEWEVVQRPRIPSSVSAENLPLQIGRGRALGLRLPLHAPDDGDDGGRTNAHARQGSGSSGGLRRAKSEVSRHRRGAAGEAGSGGSAGSLKSQLERRLSIGVGSIRRGGSGAGSARSSSGTGSSEGSSIWGGSAGSVEDVVSPPLPIPLPASTFVVSLPAAPDDDDEEDRRSRKSGLRAKLHVKVDLPSWLSRTKSRSSRSSSKSRKSAKGSSTPDNQPPPPPLPTPPPSAPGYLAPSPSSTTSASATASPTTPFSPSQALPSLLPRTKSRQHLPLLAPPSPGRRALDAVRRRYGTPVPHSPAEEAIGSALGVDVGEIMRLAERRAEEATERERARWAVPAVGAMALL